jgi:hypothetical protein
MKNILLCFFYLVLSKISIHAQNTIVKKTYYDIYKTKLKAEWQQTANGYTNGYYKEYYPSGKIYIDRIVKTEDVYPYWSYDVKCKIYDEAGGLLWSTQSIARDVYDGEQLSYNRVGPNIKLNTKALFKSGKMISFQYFHENGTKIFEIINGKTFKTFTSTGELVNNIDFSNGGLFTGNLYKGAKDEIKIELKDGKIQKIYNKAPSSSLDKWNVNRISGDTIVCTYDEKGFNYKKYYLDTVLVKLSYEPTITTKVSDIQNGELGLDFGFRNNYFVVWPNKEFSFDPKNLIFLKEEKRDSLGQNLLSLKFPDKLVDLYPSGKTKKISYGDFKLGSDAVINNWEEYDENGEIKNNLEKNRLTWYEYNYNIVSTQKLEFLRNRYGWNKLVIDLNEYRKNKSYFISSDINSVFYSSNGEISPERPYKLTGSKILLNENEAEALRILLENRARFIYSISADGKDNALSLFDEVKNEGSKLYSINVKDEYKNIYLAYSLCINHMLDSLTKVIYENEPSVVLSPQWKNPKAIDLKNDSEILQKLSKENFSDKTFDFRFTPNEWVNYNSNYLVLLKNYNDMVEIFNMVVEKNPQKAEKKLKDKTNLNEILSILNSNKY